MPTIKDYHEYFRDYATTHPDILHQEGVTGEKAFFTVNLEELFVGFRVDTKHQQVVFVLINYQYAPKEEGQSQALKNIDAGFIVMGYADRGDQGAINDMMEKTENIVDQTINTIIESSTENHPLFEYSVESADEFIAEPYQHAGDHNYFGWWVSFKFSNVFDRCNLPTP